MKLKQHRIFGVTGCSYPIQYIQLVVGVKPVRSDRFFSYFGWSPIYSDRIFSTKKSDKNPHGKNKPSMFSTVFSVWFSVLTENPNVISIFKISSIFTYRPH